MRPWLWGALWAASVLAARAQDIATGDTLRHHTLRWWPDLYTVQHAGNIGYWSVGAGWDYGGHSQWETHLMMGYLPSWLISDRWTVTLTLKQHYNPWTIKTDRGVEVTPLSVSCFLNTIINEDFWVREPERYGRNYYRFSSAVRLHVGIGSRVALRLPGRWRRGGDRVALFYELSTYDLGIITAVTNRYVAWHDVLALGFGIQYKIR